MNDLKSIEALASDMYSAIASYCPPTDPTDDRDSSLNDIAAIARAILENAGEPEHRMRLSHSYSVEQTLEVLRENRGPTEGSMFSEIEQAQRSARYILDYVSEGIAARIRRDADALVAKAKAKAAKPKRRRAKASKPEALPAGVVGRINGTPFVFALAKKK